MKLKPILIILIAFILYSCNNISDEAIKTGNTELVPKQSIKDAFYIPLTRGGDGKFEFICLLPDGKFIKGFYEYSGKDLIYYKLNEKDYSASYKIINENTIEVHEIFKEDNIRKTDVTFSFNIIDTFLGGKAYELKPINRSGSDEIDFLSLRYTSADIDVAKKLHFD